MDRSTCRVDVIEEELHVAIHGYCAVVGSDEGSS